MWSRWVARRREGSGGGSAGCSPETSRPLPAAKRILPAAAVATAAALLGQLLAGLPAAAGTTASAAAAYPLVLDVDLTPNPVCSGPVRGRVQMYDPAAAKARATVEWRVRAGQEQLAGGRVVMAANVSAAEFGIPFHQVPAAETALQVDARVLPSSADEEPGPYGKVWRDTIRQGCDPVRVASVGDSVVWGQGLDHDQKFPYLTGELLGRATGRGHQHMDYSISGAVLDAPELPAGNDDSACLQRTEKQDPDGDGEMEFGEVTQQMPDVFCQLEVAGAQARAGGYGLDLVVVNGCINDLDPFLGIAVGITPGSRNLPEAIRRECSGIGAAAENPARHVPYFSGAKVGYGGRGMQAAIEKAHSLPGRPKVIVADFYYALSRYSSPIPVKQCSAPGLAGARLATCKGALGGVAKRYEQYTQLANDAYRTAAHAANDASTDGPYAVAADGLFTLDSAGLAPRSTVWGTPFGDPMYPLRKKACPELSSTPVQCLSAAVAHPDIAGARQYADAFLLNPRVRQWFGLAPDGPQALLTVPGDARVGSEVRLTATVDGHRPPAGHRYRWYFGDGTQLETGEATTTHVYDREGPYLPRLVVTTADGRKALTEASHTIGVS
ncbi:PKD domain-containing protein [Streptomyces sp. NBC_01142]|uniref:PKD domain-containing protein n=1 Tax=Streptomyces sp. NBC_01142 TaxID=2975865 RepID=UPI00225204CE|nr:PKD domain-containing protein [Streptomyces sp. NBC_01142]MCX4825463.1 PKD domain-containing protein [Streptomyces sp. NBC_01142]